MTSGKPKLTDRQVREKLVHQGPASLNDAELLSILLGQGEGTTSAVEMAEGLLKRAGGSLVQLGLFDLKRLRMSEKLGVNRAVTVVTALELGRRYRMQEGFSQETIGSDRDVVALFQPLLAPLPHEEFWVLYLNTSNRILSKVRVGQGGVSGTAVDPKLIVKRAVEQLASAVVLVHNHPSGNPEPSPDDNQLTDKITRAAGLFDIRVVDHIIITPGICYSFREHGFFDN